MSNFITHQEIIREMVKLEEDLIRKVITQAKGSEVTLEDAKQTQIVRNLEFPDRYGIAYMGQALGMVVKEIKGFGFEITFYPGEIIFKK